MIKVGCNGHKRKQKMPKVALSLVQIHSIVAATNIRFLIGYHHCPRDIIDEVCNRVSDIIERLIEHLDPRRIPLANPVPSAKYGGEQTLMATIQHATKRSWSRVELATHEMDGT
jgi:hypothetical protein